MSLRTWIKTIVNKFAISNHMTLILGVRVGSGAEDHGKNYINVRCFIADWQN